jgi:hypothetical protein
MTGTPTDLPSGISQVGMVRIRRSWLLFLPALVPAAVVELNLHRYHDSFQVVMSVVLPVMLVLVAVFSLMAPQTTDLTRTHLIRRWGRRRRAIAWDRVQGFTINYQLGSRVLKVISDDGNSMPLSAPSTSWFLGRAKFDAQHNLIGQWWVDHRGPNWQAMPVQPWGEPPPPAPPRPSGVPIQPRPDPWIKLKRSD